MTVPYTIIVNSSDGYSDCWGPFFTLLARYWPDCAAPVLLNTELATYQGAYPVVSTCVQLGMTRRPSWDQCMAAALARVETPLVLYMQEDYFLDSLVATARLDRFAQQMIATPEIARIGLTAIGVFGPFHPTDDPELWRVDARARYRTSLQAALWRTDVMRSYLRPEENGWMFEIYGTRRSWRKRELFLTVNCDLERSQRLLPYSHAGIVKGRWDASVPAFFAREGLTLDYSARGFHRPLPKALEKLRTLRKLMQYPSKFVRGMAGR